MAKIEAEEEASWGQQFVNACMLHPTKNEDGEIVNKLRKWDKLDFHPNEKDIFSHYFVY